MTKNWKFKNLNNDGSSIEDFNNLTNERNNLQNQLNNLTNQNNILNQKLIQANQIIISLKQNPSVKVVKDFF